MGWCSGTDIFDPLVKSILDDEQLTDDQQERLIDHVVEAFEENTDWDCETDSAYWEHPMVRKSFLARFPDWFDDDPALDEDESELQI